MTIYCVGRNYADHAKELGNEIPTEPVIFLKAQSAIRGLNDQALAYPDETFHFEAELVIAITKDYKLNEVVNREELSTFHMGLDLTRRTVQSKLKEKGLPWTLAKSFQGSAILSEAFSIKAEHDLKNLTYEFYLNGVRRQKGETKNIIFSIIDICNYLNSFAPLKKGDLVYTGTPHGVGEIKQGDKFDFIFNEQLRFEGQL